MAKQLVTNGNGTPRKRQRHYTQCVTVSLYPEHIDTLRLRQRELNLSVAEVFRLLLELEQRRSMLRPELISRLTTTVNNRKRPKLSRPRREISTNHLENKR